MVHAYSHPPPPPRLSDEAQRMAALHEELATLTALFKRKAQDEPQEPPRKQAKSGSANHVLLDYMDNEASEEEPYECEQDDGAETSLSDLTESDVTQRRWQMIDTYCKSALNVMGLSMEVDQDIPKLKALFPDSKVTEHLRKFPGGCVESAPSADCMLDSEEGDLNQEYSLSAKRQYSEMVLNVLKNGLPLIGLQAGKAHKPNSKVTVSDVGPSLSSDSCRQAEKLGWPISEFLTEARTKVQEALHTYQNQKYERDAVATKFSRLKLQSTPSCGPPFVFSHVDDPGFNSNRYPADPTPLRSSGPDKADTKVTVTLGSLRDQTDLHRQIIHANNITSLTRGMLAQIAFKYIPKDDAETLKLAEHIIMIDRLATNRALVASSMAVQNHAAFERRRAFEQDTRNEVKRLDHTKKSSAVLGPVNSSDYLFGSNAQREKLFDDISKSREETKTPIIVGNPRGQNSAFRNKSTKRGGGHQPQRQGQHSQQPRAPQSQSNQGPKRGSRSGRGGRGQRGRGGKENVKPE